MTQTMARLSGRSELGAWHPALDLLRQALLRRQSKAKTWIYNVPAPLAPIETLLELSAEPDAVLWAPELGPELAAVGVTHEICGAGATRFSEVKSKAEELWNEVEASALGGAMVPLPRLIGGFSFRPGGAERPPWRGFGDARFVLPRFTYTRLAGQAALGVAVSAALLDPSQRAALLHDFELILARLHERADRAASEAQAALRVVELAERRPGEWGDLVDAIRARIASGEFEKVVLARRVLLTLDPAPSTIRILDRLRNEAPHATRFAFRRGAATFLGATPERLLAKTGLLVETEALAGSKRASGSDPGRELLDSAKDLAEHAIVVRELVRTLEPLSSSLSCPERPVLRELRHVIHLLTPIQARLHEPQHVLELVRRLHPTPAVGGAPRPAVLRWIAEHEADERGWYAGPVGWFDAQGDGDFVVALRSGVVEGCRAHLYVGAGIVRGSDAESELAETRLKLATLLGALGVSG